MSIDLEIGTSLEQWMSTVYVEILFFPEIVKNLALRNSREYAACLILRPVTNLFISCKCRQTHEIHENVSTTNVFNVYARTHQLNILIPST